MTSSPQSLTCTLADSHEHLSYRYIIYQFNVFVGLCIVCIFIVTRVTKFDMLYPVIGRMDP